MEPRGIRNNNPGNIEHNVSTKWQGLDTPASDGRFCRFISPAYGIRALARVLITYYDKHKCDTVSEIIHRWAPPNENNTNAYCNAVAAACGVGVHDIINLHDYAVLCPLVMAIIKHENGKQPYTQAQIDKGLVLAGVEPKSKPIAKTRTVAGATTATAGVTLTAATDVMQEVSGQIEPLIPYAESLKYLFIAMAIIGIGITVYARLDDRRRGLR